MVSSTGPRAHYRASPLWETDGAVDSPSSPIALCTTAANKAGCARGPKWSAPHIVRAGRDTAVARSRQREPAVIWYPPRTTTTGHPDHAVSERVADGPRENLGLNCRATFEFDGPIGGVPETVLHVGVQHRA